MSPYRIVFLGTPVFASHCLQSLIKDDHFEVVGVVSQPDRPSGRKLQLTPSPVKALALEHDIPVITPEKVREVLDEIVRWKANAAVVVAFGQILPQAFLDIFPNKVVNVHASLLPHWRGAAPIQRCIMAGEKESGVALQVMVKELDAGDLVGVRTLSVPEEMNSLELHEAMLAPSAELLQQEFLRYLQGEIQPQPQNHSKATYAHKIAKSEGLIDWEHSSIQIHNQIRGLAWGPGAFTLREGKKLKIHRTQVVKRKLKGVSGEVVEVSADEFVLCCGDTQGLRVTEVQPESKARQSVGEYLKGYPIKEGEVLG